VIHLFSWQASRRGLLLLASLGGEWYNIRSSEKSIRLMPNRKLLEEKK